MNRNEMTIGGFLKVEIKFQLSMFLLGKKIQYIYWANKSPE